MKKSISISEEKADNLDAIKRLTKYEYFNCILIIYIIGLGPNFLNLG